MNKESVSAGQKKKSLVSEAPPIGTFGTFQGVFRPTILTIIGVMLYVREGWLVGNAGLLGAFLVICMAYLITGTVALSLSSITTNIRMGQGGVFSLVAQTLGLEIGGSIGIPLYLAQGLSGAMYLHGMLEGWLSIFPGSSMQGTWVEPLVTGGYYESVVLMLFFGLAAVITWVSTSVAFKVQYVVMVFIVLALSSMAMGLQHLPELETPHIWGKFEDGNLMELFAVFFPAATGVMVGASMSGSLKNPRKSIPIGTMAAWICSWVVYVAVALVYAHLASPADLVGNMNVGIEKAAWPLLVQLGLMASCFTATLSSLAAAPRVLQALAEYRIVPGSQWLAKEKKSEPRNALMATALMVFIAMLAGDLNAIAKLLTMFFLLTYFTINTVLCIEKAMNLVSFRPLFSINWMVPCLGSVCCLVAMVVINPLLSLISLTLILAIYIVLDRRKLETPWETVHSGLFGIIANWAAKKVFISGNADTKRAWKPDILMPVERESQLEGVFRFLRSFAFPQGSVQIVGLDYEQDEKGKKLLRNLDTTIEDIQKEGIFSTYAKIEALNFTSALKTSVSVMRGSFFRPNILFVPIEPRTDEELSSALKIAGQGNMAAIFMALHSEAVFGRERSINLWIRDQSPNWQLGLQMTNIDMAVLLAYKVAQNWQAKVRLCCSVEKAENRKMTETFLKSLVDLARLGKNVEVHVTVDKFHEMVRTVPHADVNIFGASEQMTRDAMYRLTRLTESTCFFVRDSGEESALA